MLKPGTLKLTVVLGLLSGIGPLSTDMYLPSLPDLGRALGANTAQTQLTMSSYLVGFAIGQIIYGPLSDRYGRKPIMIAALTLYCLATVMCAAATTVEMLIAARMVQAIGGCGAIVLTRAIVRDLYEGARAGHEMAILSIVIGLTPILAPLLGGVLHELFGWRSNFWLMIVIGAECVALVAWYLPETLRTRAPTISPGSVLCSYRTVLRDRSYQAHTALVMLSYAGLFAWLSAASFVLQDLYKLPPAVFAVVFSASAAGFIIGTTVASRIIHLGLNRVIGLGVTAMVLGATAMTICVAFHFDMPATMVSTFAVYLIGLGLVLPQATAASLMPFPERAGAASSLLGFLQQTGAALCGVIVGHFLGASAWPLATAVLLMAWSAFLVWLLTKQVRASAEYGRVSAG